MQQQQQRRLRKMKNGVSAEQQAEKTRLPNWDGTLALNRALKELEQATPWRCVLPQFSSVPAWQSCSPKAMRDQKAPQSSTLGSENPSRT
eukprot:1152256-Pelagomonas_calceolata.AAC.5